MAFEMVFNNKSNSELDFNIVKRPNIPAPKKKYIEEEQEGQDGKTIEDTGYYEDISIEVECNFVSNNPNKWNVYFRRIKNWINNIDDYKLSFSDDQGYFYMVKKAEISDSERSIKVLGKFKIKFTLDPYMYLESGLEEIELPRNIDNEYDVCKPEYRIEGLGICTLNINGVNIACNVDKDGLILNTSLGLAYKCSDKSFANNRILIDEWSDAFIKNGENTFSWTNGFNVYLTPNWREI